MCSRRGGRGPLEKIWRIMHALLLRENTLEAVWLTCIKLGLILEKTLLHRLLHMLPLVKLRLSLVHLSHLPLLLQRALLLPNPKKKVRKGKRKLVMGDSSDVRMLTASVAG